MIKMVKNIEKETNEANLWRITNELRGSMDSNDFKGYILYMYTHKFLSEKIVSEMKEPLAEYSLEFRDLNKSGNEKIYQKIKEIALKQLGYFIEPEYLYSEISYDLSRGKDILPKLNDALISIQNSAKGLASENIFITLFQDINLKSSNAMKKLIFNIFQIIDSLEFDMDNITTIGDIFEYLLEKFEIQIGKKGGESCTPSEINELMTKLTCYNKKNIKIVYDCACGVGSSLVNINKKENNIKIYGVEINRMNSIAKMNMLVHNKPYDDFNIMQGDCLTNLLYKDMKADVIISNPPFAMKWNPKTADETQFKYGQPPKSDATYAFIQHMLYHLEDNGNMAVLVSPKTLSGLKETEIRKAIIKENLLDCIIQLPSKLMYSTAIPTVIMVFKKNRENKDILFINAKKDFGNKNRQIAMLRKEDINKIMNAYQKRETINNYSYDASFEEIEKNDFNLNIPRYVDTFEANQINIEEVTSELKEIHQKLEENSEKLEKYFRKQGEKPPLF